MIAANRDVKRKLKNVPAAELTALPTAEPTAPETPPIDVLEAGAVAPGSADPVDGLIAGSNGKDGSEGLNSADHSSSNLAHSLKRSYRVHPLPTANTPSYFAARERAMKTELSIGSLLTCLI